MKVLLGACVALSLILAATGCQDADFFAPEPEVAGFEVAPPTASGIVRRGTADQWWWIRKGDTATVLIGTEDIRTLCDPGEPTVYDGIDYHTVISPTGTLRVLLKSKVHVQVYPPMAVNCTNLTEVPQVADGYAKFVQADSEYDGNGPGGRVKNLKLTGWVFDADGQKYRLLTQLNLVASPHADDNKDLEIKNLKIQMTPVH
jgi:hypothetical protein